MSPIIEFSTLVVRPTIVLLMAGLVAFALRGSSAAARHIVWGGALIVALTIPVFGAFVPEVPVPISQNTARLVDLVPSSIGQPTSASPASDGQASDTGGFGFDNIPWLLIWLTGFGLLLGVLGMRILALRHLERFTLRPADKMLKALMEDGREKLGITRPVSLLVGGVADMPMTWGYVHPRIALPSSASDWPQEQTEAVLLHELAHVRRGDVVVHRVAEIARAAFWFNPLTWYATRRLLVEREHACDDEVLRAGVKPPEYAHQLLAMANSLKTARIALAASLPMARRSQMTGRLMAILDEGRIRWSPSHRSLVLVSGLALLVAASAAALRPESVQATPRHATTPQQAVATGEPVAESPASLGGCWNPVGAGTNSNRNHDPGRITAEWRTARCTGDLLITGEVTLRRDSLGFATMSPGALVRIRENEAGSKRQIEVRPDAATSAGDAQWLRLNLRPLLRLTGVEIAIGSEP